MAAENFYTLQVAGLTRKLRYFPLGNGKYIAGFIMFGDIELTERCAEALLEKCPPYDVIVTSEAKGIPLAYEMAKRHRDSTYVVARKQQKLYMSESLSVDVTSITTLNRQRLYLDGADLLCILRKRVLILDDVISTGATIGAVERLVGLAGGIVAGRACVLTEGDSIGREDIISLSSLPIFTEAEVMGAE